MHSWKIHAFEFKGLRVAVPFNVTAARVIPKEVVPNIIPVLQGPPRCIEIKEVVLRFLQTADSPSFQL